MAETVISHWEFTERGKKKCYMKRVLQYRRHLLKLGISFSETEIYFDDLPQSELKKCFSWYHLKNNECVFSKFEF